MSMHPFRAAVEAGDPEAAAALMSPNVVFNSPVKFKPFTGRETVGVILGAVIQVFEDFRYTDELASEDGATTVLVFRARVGEREVEGLDLLRTGNDGLVD